MKPRTLNGRVISRAAFSAALVVLIVGQVPAGYVWGAAFALTALALAIAARLRRWEWYPGAFLAAYTAAAAGSLLAGAPFHWMATGMITALAANEFAEDEDGLEVNAVLRSRFQTRRLMLLGVVAGLGLAAALLASRLDIIVPFGGMGLAALAALFGLYRLAGLFRR